MARSWPKRRSEDWLNHAESGRAQAQKFLQMLPFCDVRRCASSSPTRPVTPEVAGSSPVAPVPVQAVPDVLEARASARAFVLVRFGQMSFTDEAAERRGEMLADLLTPLRRLELMDV